LKKAIVYVIIAFAPWETFGITIQNEFVPENNVKAFLKSVL